MNTVSRIMKRKVLCDLLLRIAYPQLFTSVKEVEGKNLNQELQDLHHQVFKKIYHCSRQYFVKKKSPIIHGVTKIVFRIYILLH